MSDLQSQVHDYNLLDFYGIVLDKTEYAQKLKLEETTEAEARLENLEELSNAITQFLKEREGAGLQEFLEEMALVSDIDSMDDELTSVTLMTMHVSKGLEFPFVFIVGLEENLFPSGMSEDDDPGEMEEERRLAYVGMTRARQKLCLTYARSRKVWGQEQHNAPSRFLKEIPNDLVEFSTALETPKFVSRFQNSTNSAPQYRNSGFSSGIQEDVQEFPDYDSSSGGSDFSKGQRVRHPTFGVGSIFQIEGSGEQQKVSVMFTDQTIKKFVTKYARLERL
jgi:DNA helicase-2/ATP-dependent DNA helicase PcrA